jgi:hypothetical protein
MMTHEDLIARIDAHLAASGETPSAFGRRVAKDSNLVADLRDGRSPTLRLAERILAAAQSGDARA